MTKKQILVFDANIFLSGINFNLIKKDIYTTASVVKEVDIERYSEKNRNILNKIHAAIDNKQLFVRDPSNKSIKKIEREAENTGDVISLSKPDKELLALGLDLKEQYEEREVVIYSDDYAVQNICLELNIPYSQLFREGIKSKIRWEIFCPGCGKVYSSRTPIKNCENCSSEVRRRKKRKR